MITQKNSNSTVHNSTNANEAHESTKEDRIIALLGDTTLPVDFLDCVRKQAEARIPLLAHGQPYTSKKICGSEFWSQLSKAECILAGRCIAYLVSIKRLPLRPVEPTRANASQYRLE